MNNKESLSMQVIYGLCLLFGWNPKVTWRALRGFLFYIRDWKAYSRFDDAEFPIRRIYPCLVDRFEMSGNVERHYFYQDILVAQRIFRNGAVRHVDVGSRVSGFVAHVASFREIEVVDIRPAPIRVANVKFCQMDFSAPLTDENKSCCDSVSCLHAIEHFGLGRYGDSVDPMAYKQAVANLHDMLKPGGKLYFSVPIGPQRVEFNAHRVFAVKTVLECFGQGFSLDEFAYIDDLDQLHENVELDHASIDQNFGCHYGCGIFFFTKTGLSSRN